ncbi:carbon starvation CstA family protein [Alicyclobacillus macrosporangiidus]|uniref:Carbon starvation protein n=1 Tax=Alicyclobacillus macrosporangiidus TaxID=392015 RepID=A0A1I7GII2_9BACL|nr:carbon starvation CstA family protein [Alicyclobacillus macrosporangiidus]SFU48225.1 carbon starvation protein [Alicyclobacillus macrosporangiidus]
MGKKAVSIAVWTVISILGAIAFATLAWHRGETVSAAWMIVAAVVTYAVAYRFYSKFIGYRVFGLNDGRATPAQVINDGKDFVPTNRWVLFGHHFAAIAGAGPLVGPVLAAQMGYLPGTLWILIGVALAGAVQDFVVLMGSMRRNGKSLGQMAKDEIGPVAGVLGALGIFFIMIILIAVLAMVVVNALKGSPWGTFTIAMTIPIAIIMGLYMRFVRPGKVLEGSLIGLVLLILALIGGQAVANSSLAPYFTFSGQTLAILMMIYGFIASVLPVWLLLAPRDYLSSFLKIGTIFLLALGILLVLPNLKMPSVSRFVDGTGPVFAGPLFPFLFITIACGAVSGFHSLVSSGTTPKMLEKESHARFIGFGGMLMESGVGIMAMIAACALDPGVYFAMNSPAAAIGTDVANAAHVISSWGFQVTPDQITNLAKEVGEKNLLSRTGGAPTLAVGMASLFSHFFGGFMAFWYHFAILFEAVFILTTIDAGTRIGRFMLQDLIGNVYKPFANTRNYGFNVIASAITVAGWGYFLYQGVTDPYGGINSLWALFGIANQMLAGIAFAVVTTILIKMGKARYSWVTIVPMVWLLVTTLGAGLMKVFSGDPKIGFYAHAALIQKSIDAGKVVAPMKDMGQMHEVVFNDHLDAIVTLVFVAVVVLVVLAALRIWYKVLFKKERIALQESEFVPAQGASAHA